jgi:hypothetical protein
MIKNFMIMKDFFTGLITLLFFIVAIALFYAAITVTYPSVLVNIVLILVSIFVLLQGCERFDKAYELGEYSDKHNNDEDQEQ